MKKIAFVVFFAHALCAFAIEIPTFSHDENEIIRNQLSRDARIIDTVYDYSHRAASKLVTVGVDAAHSACDQLDQMMKANEHMSQLYHLGVAAACAAACPCAMALSIPGGMLGIGVGIIVQGVNTLENTAAQNQYNHLIAKHLYEWIMWLKRHDDNEIKMKEYEDILSQPLGLHHMTRILISENLMEYVNKDGEKLLNDDLENYLDQAVSMFLHHHAETGKHMLRLFIMD